MLSQFPSLCYNHMNMFPVIYWNPQIYSLVYILYFSHNLYNHFRKTTQRNDKINLRSILYFHFFLGITVNTSLMVPKKKESGLLVRFTFVIHPPTHTYTHTISKHSHFQLFARNSGNTKVLR